MGTVFSLPSRADPCASASFLAYRQAALKIFLSPSK